MLDETKYMTISELTRIIKIKFDNSTFFNRVFIKGEISNFKRQVPSGHCYFTIKDEGSRISAVMFKGSASKVDFDIKDGDLVCVTGKISIYEASGNYQIYVEDISLSGSGDLYKKFLELKDKLNKAGLFAIEHKKAIPKFPEKIGIVTASTGAAIRDIITTIKRRYPICEVILFPSLVQGIGSKEDIVKQINRASDYDIDVLIVGRGGGSIEDLWAFNEEIVAHAIYNSKIPVISAVGHEIDFTIADYVADKRAATPTAAAELAVPNIQDIMQNIDNLSIRLNRYINNIVEVRKEKIEFLKNSYILKSPINIYCIKKQLLEISINNLNTSINNAISGNKVNLFRLQNSYVLNNPSFIYNKKELLLNKLIEKLEILNPLNSLKRGYAIVKKENISIMSVKKVSNNDKIDIRVSDGLINATVYDIKEEV